MLKSNYVYIFIKQKEIQKGIKNKISSHYTRDYMN